MPPIPVTVLTGFLGAGKTTLLNRVLTGAHGKRYAVIVNEFGEAGIDNELVATSDEEIFEMNNGCVCCTVRGDLIRMVAGLTRRKGRLDGILVETTGLADPAPVIQTFFLDAETRERAALDSVATVVDARHVHAQLESQPEAREQVVFADLVIVNKADLVDAQGLEAAVRAVRSLNPRAEVLVAERCDVPVEKVLGRGSFDLAKLLDIEPDLLDENAHEHSHGHVGSVSLVSERPVDFERFKAWIGGYLNEHGQRVMRCKGVLHLPGERQRMVFQGVHMLLEMGFGLPWREGERPMSKAVFIGKNLDRLALEIAFRDCLVKQ
ncbi:putative GTP-binding protein YjiA [Fundidesulfovibrio magnetotacticus]|uniref:Putative GTP-binding protein YjiA n=1 Tax=Fundidesulfovibrio magnetotacticus TaxID=2730080 RepID=A0A6V8LX00_9BACT|nr:GTP-binding protein [Fundidesulfovibrio magnetotacticus]GFK94609.1 putative GTP-binding protein YjiA [Fundidesulfovibrio magnetotacticus]